MPYYDRDGITLYLADCRDVLPRLQPGTVDLILTDPPYGETSLDWDVAVGDWLDVAEPLLTDRGSLWCFGSFRFFLKQSLLKCARIFEVSPTGSPPFWNVALPRGASR